MPKPTTSEVLVEQFRNVCAAGDVLALQNLLVTMPATEFGVFYHTLKVPDNAGLSYSIFYKAITRGQVPIVKLLLQYVMPPEARTMLEYRNHYAFRLAAEYGQVDVLAVICELLPEQISTMIAFDCFAAFRAAAKSGHVEVLEFLRRQAPTQIAEMISIVHYEAFREGVKHGHFKVVEFIKQYVTPAQTAAMIEAGDFKLVSGVRGYPSIEQAIMAMTPAQISMHLPRVHYDAFFGAVVNGHLDMVKRIWAMAPTQISTMIKAVEYRAFFAAIRNGHLEILQALWANMTESDIVTVVKMYDYQSFFQAAAAGKLHIVRAIWERVPGEIFNMIAVKEFAAFRIAAANNHLELVQAMWDMAPPLVTEMIKACKYSVFVQAAERGAFEFMRVIWQRLSPELCSDMLVDGDSAAFRAAAKKGHDQCVAAILDQLEQVAPEEISETIKSHCFDAYRQAAMAGHSQVIRVLLQRSTPSLIKTMIDFKKFEIFRVAVQAAHIAVVQAIWAKATPEQISAMVTANHYWAFCEVAKQKEATAAVNVFLSFPEVFTYAVQHIEQYSHHVTAFITTQLHALIARSDTPEEIVLSPQEAVLYVHIQRYLMRQPDTVVKRKHLSLLGRIPAVQAQWQQEGETPPPPLVHHASPTRRSGTTANPSERPSRRRSVTFV